MRLVLATTKHISDPLGFIQDCVDTVPWITGQFSLLLPLFSIVNLFEHESRDNLQTPTPLVDVKDVHEFSCTFGTASETNVAVDCTKEELWAFRHGHQGTELLWKLIDEKVGSSDIEYSTFMQALAERDPGTHLDGLEGQYPTMRWIATHDTFLNWLASSENGFLHVHGKPGSGSSAIASFIKEHLTAIHDLQDSAFITFCCHRQYVQTTDTATILLSLCRQLLSATPALYRRTQPTCKALLEQALFNTTGMWALFQSLLEYHPNQVFVFIDGIHNCEDSLIECMSAAGAIPREGSGPLKFIFAGFYENDITFPGNLTTTISTLDLINSDNLSMKTATEEAVKQRVHGISRQSNLWLELQHDIIRKVCEEPSPYLLMMQKLSLLESSIRYSTEATLRSRLTDLPKSLDALYSYYIGELTSWERQVLGCVVTATQPLRPIELATCLALQGGKAPTLRDLRQYTSHDIVQDISASRGIAHLIRVKDTRLYPVDETLTDYLHTSHKQVSRDLHFSMMKACIKYISHFYHDRPSAGGGALGSGVTRDAEMATRSKETEFLRYAALCWPDHYNLCHGHPKAHELVSYLFRNPPLRSTWFRLCAHFKSHVSDSLEPLASPLATASKLGLTQIVDELVKGIIPGAEDAPAPPTNPLADDRISKRQSWSRAVTLRQQLVDECVSFAAAEGREELISQLSHASVLSPSSLENKGNGDLTPILQAVQGGHLATVDALARHGASTAAIGRDGSTMLHIATRLGNMPMVEMVLALVLEDKAGIAVVNNSGYDAVKIAAESGYHAILSLLLEKIGNKKEAVNKPFPSSNKTPIFLAARHGHAKVVELLLASGADPTIRDDSESSALYQAAKEGDVYVLDMLLKYPAYHKLKLSKISDEAVQERPNTTETAHISTSDDLEACLLVAAEHGREPIVKLLLEFDIRGNRPGTGQNTALHLAARKGFAQVVEMLMGKGFEVNSQNDELMTPIQLAAQSGHLEVVKVLHERGQAKITSGPGPEPPFSIEPSLSALELAAQAGHVGVVEYLVELDAQAAAGALALAAQSGHYTVVHSLMLKLEQDSGSAGHEEIMKSAQLSIERRNHRVLDELLTPKVTSGLETETASAELYDLLYSAIKSDDDRIVRVLVQKNFDMNKLDGYGEHPLHRAVTWTKPNAIKPLVDGGADVEYRDNNGETPLYAAARSHKPQVVERLLEAGANPNKSKVSDGTTPLHKASSSDQDNSEVIASLLRYKASLSAIDERGWTPLHHATNKKSLPNATALVGSNGERKELLGALNNYKSTPLVLAAETGVVDVIRFFLRHGADPTTTNKSGSSALHRAAGGGHLETVKLLIENPYKRADPGMAKKNGATALHMAIAGASVGLVKYLLGLDGVDKNAQSDVLGTPLCVAAIHYIAAFSSREAELQICQLLVDAGADVNLTGGPHHSPLHSAAIGGRIKLAELLLANEDINLNTISETHGTPLSCAIEGEEKEVTSLLLKRGADPNILVAGKAAMQLAIQTGDSEMVEIVLSEAKVPLDGVEGALWAAVRKDMLGAVRVLIEHVKDISTDSESAHGCTLLTYAILWESTEVIKYLLANTETHKIDINEPNKAGDAAIHMAVKAGNDDLVVQLLEHGANPNSRDLTDKTPVMLSARGAESNILRLLLDAKADILLKDRHNRDALYWACLSGSADIVKQVRTKTRESSSWRASCAATLHHVVLTGGDEAAELLDAILCDENPQTCREIVDMVKPDRNNWTLAYALEHSPDMFSALPGWFSEYIKESQGEIVSEPNAPSRWDSLEVEYPLEVADDGQSVTVGSGPLPSDDQETFALIRSDFCIPLAAESDYYFDISVSKPEPSKIKIEAETETAEEKT